MRGKIFYLFKGEHVKALSQMASMFPQVFRFQYAPYVIDKQTWENKVLSFSAWVSLERGGGGNMPLGKKS